MSKMVERVAKAIEDARDEDLPDPVKMARAAIAAMREPSENMLFVGSNEDAGYEAADLAESWRLMIDEALK